MIAVARMAIDEARDNALRRDGQYHLRSDCRLCSGSLTTVLELPSTPLANEYPEAPITGGQDEFPLYLCRCDDCGHVQLPVIVNPERLFHDYAYVSSTSPVFVQHLKDFARDVRPVSGRTILEIGSNDGTLLKEYHASGFGVWGVDPARNLAYAQKDYPGFTTLAHFFTEALADGIAAQSPVQPYPGCDLIVALNVFAHADDLRDIARGVKRLLAEKGQFVFEVGYLPDMIARGVYRVIYHEHLSFHSLRPLVSFFERLGLALVDAHRVPTQGGSIRCFVRQDQVQKSERLLELLEAETDVATDAHRLANRITDDRASIHEKLDQLKAAGKVVCGYGAPAQLTTTCYALGVTADDIAFVCDDNPLKQGRYTPGRFIPIMPPELLHKSDACVIFSGNFAADIRARHADYKGEWVTI